MSPRKNTKSLKAARRQSAEARQAYYDALTTEQKLRIAKGKKERMKLAKRQKKEEKNR